jgi:nucleoside 2-deoxyribosyltransferase
MGKKIYLAIPYSRYEEKSFTLANEIAAELIRKGYIVFSPISMSHPIATIGGLQGDWETWKKIDLEFIKWCDEVIVIDFDEVAVNESTGVQDELKFAKEIGKPILYYYKENWDFL